MQDKLPNDEKLEVDTIRMIYSRIYALDRELKQLEEGMNRDAITELYMTDDRYVLLMIRTRYREMRKLYERDNKGYYMDTARQYRDESKEFFMIRLLLRPSNIITNDERSYGLDRGTD